MKKLFIFLLTTTLLTACSQQTSQFIQNGISSRKQQIKSCLTTEAMNRLQDGSLFAASLRTNVNQITDSCLDQQVPKQERTPLVTQETKLEAKTIITTLLNMSEKKK